LTQDKIQRKYKLLAYILGGISFVIIIVPFGDYDLKERAALALIFNIEFHLPYYIFSLAPLTQLNRLKGRSPSKEMLKSAFIAMSYMVIAASLFISIIIIRGVISSRDFTQLISLLVVPGIILGALKLNFELRGKK